LDKGEKMDTWIIKFRESLFVENKSIDEIRGTANTIITRMTEEINHLYSDWIPVKAVNDFQLKLNYYGNEIFVKAEIPLSTGQLSGNINCYLNEGKEELTVLKTTFSFDLIGNIDGQYTAYQCANVLIKQLHDELCEKQILIKK
jgi:hypothetical protein